MRLPLVALVLLLAAAGGLALALSASGGDEARGDGRSSARFLPGSPRQGAGGGLNQIPEADCAGWRRASIEQKRYAIAQLGAHFSRRTRGGGGHKLPDPYASQVVERACANGFATRFKLWKVYEKALAFQYDRSVAGG